MLPDYEDLRLDRDLMEMMCEIRRMDNEIGEIILTSGEMVTWVDEVIDTEIQAYEKGGYDEPPGLRDAYHVAGLFVLPWDPEEVCELDSYITGGDVPDVPDGMEDLLDWVNTSPYDQFVTASVFLSESEELEGLDRMTAWSLFRALLYNTGLENIGSCKIYDKIIEEYDVTSGKVQGERDRQSIIRDVTTAIHESYKEAIDAYRDMDISKDLDGNELSFIRNSRSCRGSFTVQDASSWTNGLEALEELNKNGMLRDEIREYLGPIYDLERLSSRISYKSANPRDLIAFASSLEMLPYIKQVLKEFKTPLLQKIYEDMDSKKT